MGYFYFKSDVLINKKKEEKKKVEFSGPMYAHAGLYRLGFWKHELEKDTYLIQMHINVEGIIQIYTSYTIASIG